MNDIHIDSKSTGIQSQNARTAVKTWITNATNIATWNILGSTSNGDHVFDNPGDVTAGTADANNALMVDLYTAIHNAGLKVSFPPGNHDITFGASTAVRAMWNNYLALLATSYADLVARAQWNTTTWGQVDAVNTYTPFAFVSQGLTYKFALIGLNFQATAADISAVRAWMSANPDRQFIITTHMFISDAASGGGTVHPCIYGEANCTSHFQADPGNLDGAGMWDALKSEPNLIAIACGHWHKYGATTLTGTNGNSVAVFMGWNLANSAFGNIQIMKFIPATHTLEVWAWRAATNVVNNVSEWSTTGKVTFAWTPKGSSSLTVSPTSLAYTCTSGGSVPGSQSVAVSLPGDIVLDNWSASKTQSWLSLSPASGSAAGSFAASVNCTGLTVGSYSDTITVTTTTSGISGATTQTIPVSVTAVAGPVISTLSLPGGLRGAAYAQTLAVTGGRAAYTWSIASGTLCGGLSLNSSTGAITGTPTSLQTCSFTVRVTDADLVSADQALSILVVPLPQTGVRAATTTRGVVVK